MISGSKGLHHFHIRKRIHQKFEQYPHPDKLKRLMDRLIYGAVFFSPLMTLPQIAEIWWYKNAADVSTISWVSYFIVALFWLGYGLLHRDKPIIITNIIWIIFDMVIVIGTIIY